MKTLTKYLTLAAVVLSLLCVPAIAQTAPSGGCNLLPNGNSPLYAVGGTVFYCPTDTLIWAQLPRLSAPERTLLSTGLETRRMAHATYNFAVDGGAIGTITPAVNFTLPTNAVITSVALNSTTAVTSAGSATVAVGTTAGSSATSLVAATAKTSWSANAFVQGVPVPQTASTWIKLSAAGQAQITVGTAALTAGVIEIYVEYYVSTS